jgi:5'-deoxynucleotidase YfbR-like HD superfamily hydrolase
MPETGEPGTRNEVQPTELFIAKVNSTIDLCNIDSRVINNDAIAHSLALINRFNGHTKHPYSVAQHTLNLCAIFNLSLTNAHPDLLFWLAYHDAPEILTGDITAPVKTLLTDKITISEIHDTFYHLLSERYDKAPITPEIKHIVKQWDLLIGTMECDYFHIPVNNDRLISSDMQKIRDSLQMYAPFNFYFCERSWDDVESELNAFLDTITE